MQAKSNWFPQTKLHPPRIGEDILVRPRLIEELSRVALTHKVTLLSAPAGSGKTSLLGTWLQGDGTEYTSWLRLDEDDNEPGTFLSVLLDALRQVSQSFGRNVETLLNTVPDIDKQIRRVIGVFINDLIEFEHKPLLIVLDDVHVISAPAVIEGLDYLIENLPSEVHLVLSTRYDPPLALARLRARGQLAEIRLPKLRFELEECLSLLNGQLNLDLPSDEVQVLQSQTDGWIAGIRLLALSLSGYERVSQGISSTAQLGEGGRYVFDFLAEEVLNNQESDVRQFLLETSILTELTPSLSKAVTHQSSAAQVLDEIYRRNLFLTLAEQANTEVIGQTEQTFRYHDLFRDFLLKQLKLEFTKEQIQALHRRAAEAVNRPSDAIRHFLEAELWAEAATAIEGLGREQLENGFVRIPISWIDALPGDVKEQRPWLILISAYMNVQRGQMRSSEPQLEELLTVFIQQDDADGEAYTLNTLAQIALAKADPVKALTYIHELLERPLSKFLRTCALVGHVWGSFYMRDWRQISASIEEIFDLAQDYEDRGIFQMLVQGLSLQILFCDLGLEHFKTHCEQVFQKYPSEGGVVEAATNALRGAICFLEGDVFHAKEFAILAEDIRDRLGGLAWHDIDIDTVFLMVSLAYEDFEAIEYRFNLAHERRKQSTTYEQHIFNYQYAQARALCLQDRLDEAKEVFSQMLEDQSPDELLESRIARLFIASFIARSESRWEDAEKALNEAGPLQRQMGHFLVFSPVELELASLYLDMGQSSQAVISLRAGLDELTRRGMPGIALQLGRSVIPLMELAIENGIYLDLAKSLLGFWTSEDTVQPVPIADTGEVLTRREVEVLRLLSDGLTNREIANTLVITERTVKAHVTSILRKLNVNTRTEAASRVQRLGLRL